MGGLHILVVEVSLKTIYARKFCHPSLLLILVSQFCVPALLEESTFKLHSPTLQWLWHVVDDRFLSPLHQAEGKLFCFLPALVGGPFLIHTLVGIAALQVH